MPTGLGTLRAAPTFDRRTAIDGSYAYFDGTGLQHALARYADARPHLAHVIIERLSNL
jgi:hypothetical protein